MERIDCGDGYVNVSFVYDELTPARHASAIRKLVEYLVRSEGGEVPPEAKGCMAPTQAASSHSRRARRVPG